MNIKRNALLLGCPGGERNTKYLPGVKADLSNINSSLQTPQWGCFLSSEISSLYNSTLSEVTEALRHINSDYSIIYFSGHGYFDTTSNLQMVCLKDCDIPLKYLFTHSRVECVIMDGCRKYLPTISGIPEMLEHPDYFDQRRKARAYFDTYIQNASEGKLILYSTKLGTISWDTQNGGRFTNAMVREASAFKTQGLYEPILINSFLPSVSKRMNEHSSEKQIPKYFHTPNYNMPIIIGAPPIASPESDVGKVVQTRSNTITNPVGQLITTGLVLYGLYKVLRTEF